MTLAEQVAELESRNNWQKVRLEELAQSLIDRGCEIKELKEEKTRQFYTIRKFQVMTGFSGEELEEKDRQSEYMYNGHPCSKEIYEILLSQYKRLVSYEQVYENNKTIGRMVEKLTQENNSLVDQNERLFRHNCELRQGQDRLG